MVGVRVGLRACPICPGCGGKKFRVIERDDAGNNGAKVTVECLSCAKRIVV